MPRSCSNRFSVTTAAACGAGGPEGSGIGGGGADGHGGMASEISSGTFSGTIGASAGADAFRSPLERAVGASTAGAPGIIDVTDGPESWGCMLNSNPRTQSQANGPQRWLGRREKQALLRISLV